MQRFFPLWFAIIGLLASSSCAMRKESDVKVSETNQPASATKVTAKSKSKQMQIYGVPVGKFTCRNKKNAIFDFKISNGESYIGKTGQVGKYTLLNDDLIYFQNSDLKGFFGQIKSLKEIRIFKSNGAQRVNYFCELN